MDVSSHLRLLTLCLRNVLRRRARTTLCIAGVALAVMSMVTVTATFSSYTSCIKSMNTFFEDEIIVVSKNQLVIQALPVFGGNLLETIEQEVKSTPGVKGTVPMLFFFSMELTGSIEIVPMNITVGIPAGNWTILTGQTPLRSQGKWPSKDTSHQIVVGSIVADRQGITVNSTVSMKNNNLTVSGILDTHSVILGRMILMPLKTAQEIFHYPRTVSMIVAKPEEEADIEMVEALIESGLNNPKKRVKALTSEERNNLINPLLDEVNVWNFGISSILFTTTVMIVALVAMINVSERRRDFAILDAIGASFTSKLFLVVAEIGLIALVGCVTGILLGVMATIWVVVVYTKVPIQMVISGLPAIISPLSVFETVVAVVMASCLVGLIPALTAARTSIAELLKSEY